MCIYLLNVVSTQQCEYILNPNGVGCCLFSYKQLPPRPYQNVDTAYHCKINLSKYQSITELFYNHCQG